MIILADNDIVHKLACCDLLDDMLQLLECPPNEVQVLPTMKFVVRRKLRDQKNALASFERFLSKVVDISPPAQEAMARFQDVADIDAGEQQLIAKAFDDEAVIGMITGDKRALKAFDRVAQFDADLLAKLSAMKVLCLEAIMLGLIERMDFLELNLRISSALASKPRGLDVVLQASFGAKRTVQNSRDTLDSYLRSLQEEVNFLKQDWRD